ncbi:MAG: DUF3987 domain-containing protein [Rubrivivax sp.]|nr:DUF3987 domain-containing protein [Rubrivivax sp.]
MTDNDFNVKALCGDPLQLGRSLQARQSGRRPHSPKERAPAAGTTGAHEADQSNDAVDDAPDSSQHGHDDDWPHWPDSAPASAEEFDDLSFAQAVIAESRRPRLTLTLFASHSANQGRRQGYSWSQAVQMFQKPALRRAKAACGMFRTGTSEDNSKANGHAPITQWSALVVEHDAETVPLHEGAAMLRAAGVWALLSTSASHLTVGEKSRGGPRWRAVLPLARPASSQAEYQRLVRCTNGPMQGCLAPESNDTARVWYYGRVRGVPYAFEAVEGAVCIDELDELVGLEEVSWVGHPGATRGRDEGGQQLAEPDSFERLTLAHEVSARTIHDLRFALEVIPSDARAMWIDKVGHALAFLRESAFGDQVRDLWIEYTTKSLSYQPGDEDQWDTIKRVDRIAHVSIFFWADEIDPSWRERAAASWVDADVAVDLQSLPVAPVMATVTPQALEAPHGFPEPYPGVMAEAVAAGLRVAPKPQPELTTLAVLTGMAAGCPGRYRLPGDGRLNLYALGLAETGAGKDLPRRVGVEIANLAGAAVIGEPASGQGLEDALTPGQGMLVAIDEAAHMLAAMNDANAPAHLKVLAGNLLKLYSAGSGHYACRVRARTKETGAASRGIANPCLNVLGFTTPESLGTAVSAANVGDGLLGRVLMVSGRSGVRPRLLRGGLDLPDLVRTAAAKVCEADNALAFGAGTALIDIDVADEAKPQLEQLLVRLDDEANAPQQSPFARAVLQRTFEKALRIAGVLAVWDHPPAPVISLAHLAWAERAVRASNEAMLAFITGAMHEGPTQANAARILDVVRKALRGELRADRGGEAEALAKGWVPASLVLRRSKLAAREMTDAVQHLKAAGEIEVGAEKRDGAKGGTRIVQLLRILEGE